MKEAAANLDFERAALLRDRAQAVELVTKRHETVTALRGDQDILAVAQNAGCTLVEVFSVRDGRALGRGDFVIEGAGDLPPSEVLRSFVLQYYGAASSIPPLVLLQHAIADGSLIQGWLSESRGSPARIIVPRRGVRLRLVQTVADDVARELVGRGTGATGEPSTRNEGLRQLKEVLGLPSMPERIEGFDISTIHGQQAVGSMVVFERGVPKPSDYRRFKIRTVSGQDDYSMMREVLQRRFARLDGDAQPATRAVRAWASPPNLVLVDGGRGQLGVAVAVRDAAGASSVRVASLAKEHELVFYERKTAPAALPDGSPGLLLLQAVRDEAHRFAVAYHRNLRDSSAVASVLDGIPGIGPRRKRSLLVSFGSLEALRNADVDEVARRGRLSRALAEQVKYALSAPET
jgi:excinuclease ABC subunit C